VFDCGVCAVRSATGKEESLEVRCKTSPFLSPSLYMSHCAFPFIILFHESDISGETEREQETVRDTVREKEKEKERETCGKEFCQSLPSFKLRILRSGGGRPQRDEQKSEASQLSADGQKKPKREKEREREREERKGMHEGNCGLQ